MTPEATHRYVNRYVKLGLAAMPDVLETLLVGSTPQELDARPDPDRFTLREAIAHVADWEAVWLQRMQRIQAEENPLLPSYDEGQWAIDHHYAQSNLTEQLAKFRTGRAALVALLETVPENEWGRTGQHGQLGSLTFAELASLVLGHDGYHLQQVVHFRRQLAAAG